MAQTESALYATDNSDGASKLSRIDTTGNVTAIVEADGATEGYRCAGILAGQNLSVLMEGQYTEDGVSKSQYRIAEYTQELAWISHSAPIRFEGDGTKVLLYRIVSVKELPDALCILCEIFRS